MARATQATLQQLGPWLDEVRSLGIDGLVEKANGAFYQRRVGILHFHEDADGVAADVKIGGVWRRVPIDANAGKREVISLLEMEYVRRRPAPGGSRGRAALAPRTGVGRHGSERREGRRCEGFVAHAVSRRTLLGTIGVLW